MFIGREKELESLNRLYQQNKFQLFVLYGRRRVGKTALLKEFCKDKPAVFYSAEQSNEKLNLEKFSAQIFEHYGETALEAFSSWERALLYLNDRQEEPLVLVLDEFPYLAHISPAILSMLQHLIDHKLQNGKLFVILCGSYMGFMEKEVLGAKSPLFGRRTGQLKLKPFDYYTAVRFFEGFTDEEKLLLYGAFGGTPMYLGQVRKEKTWEENIMETYLMPTGYLYEEALLLLRQEVQEPGVYHAIVEAVAGGAVRANEIAAKTGEPAAKCLKYIQVLCELGILYKEQPFGEKETSRKTLYHVSDFMFCFWFRYVAGNRTLLETGAQEIVLQRKILPDYSHYMGMVFEQICRDYLLHKNSKGELPILFTEIGRWRGTDSVKRKQVEIDLVAGDGESFLFGECKWRNEPLDLDVLYALQEKADVCRRYRKQAWYILFSKSGFSRRLYEIAENREDVLLVSMGEMLKQTSLNLK